MSRGITFQVRIVLTEKEYRKVFMEEVKHRIVKECELVVIESYQKTGLEKNSI